MVSGILLAAGESSRMQGAFKPLLKWGKRTVIGQCVNQMQSSRLGDIFIVLGHREAEIRPALAGTGVQFAINRNYRQGMLSSIKTGLAMLGPNSDGFLLALVDQPMIDANLINSLITAFEKSDKGIVVPTFEGRWGHPVIISTVYIEEIMQIDDNSPAGLRGFLEEQRRDLLEVPVATSAVIVDIDLPEDYERLSQQVKSLYEFHKWHP
ncbi:MAG: nucleotidyltransferase family protein [Acidobacteria bacterium]|nr:nucleotidyltransferase family protein [Acidobacteriota bacterium]